MQRLGFQHDRDLLTPVLVGLLMPHTGGDGGGVSLKAVFDIVLRLLLPFVLGHLSRPLTASLVARHKAVLNLVDRVRSTRVHAEQLGFAFLAMSHACVFPGHFSLCHP